jgi:hypothetical protein
MATLIEADAQIAASKVQLKRARNAQAPICQLPIEILVRIITCLQHTGDCWDEDRPWRSYYPRWSRAMLTCAHFRETIVHAPVLWTILDYEQASPKWLQLCVERHGDVPLFIHGHSGVSWEHLSRARSAHLRHLENPTSLDFPAPALRVLKASCYSTATVFYITPQLLGGNCTRLVSLKLRGNRFYLSNPLPMPALRYLELSSIHTSYDLLPLLQLLVNAPALQELQVTCLFLLHEFALEDPTRMIPIPPTPFELPHLQRLQITDTPAEASALVRMLLPAQAHADTHIRVDRWARHGEDDARQFSENHAIIHQAWRARTTSMNRTGEMRIRVPYRTNDRTAIALACSDDSHEHDLFITGDIGDVSAGYLSFLLADVHALHLDWDRYRGQDHEQDTYDFGVLRCLQHLDTLSAVHFDLEATFQRNLLKKWIRNCRTQIRVRLVDCSSQSKVFVQELLDESTVSEVTWVDE